MPEKQIVEHVVSLSFPFSFSNNSFLLFLPLDDRKSGQLDVEDRSECMRRVSAQDDVCIGHSWIECYPPLVRPEWNVLVR